MKELPKVYEPQKVEKKIYDFWMQGGWFKGVIDPEKKPFSIVMPPPNVTGQLHMGHAMDSTLQDILTRYKRMQGYSALWLPGVDHAGIATQIKVEETLRKEEGKTRYDLGRDKFLERVWAWKEQYGDRIVEQQKSMGVSCDWDRSRFTMDETCAKAVRETFCDLYEKGLIYKGRRIINWCPHCRTALSDAEVEYKDIPGHFWHIRYPIEDSDEALIIATTRPETMLGDSGVAVHPEDERYAHLVGKNAILPLVGRKLPIVADEYVELGFGTGAVKMTPCHDPNDYEVGLRHNLEQIQVIDEDAKICGGYKYDGMDRYEARKAIVEDLTEQGYLVKVEPYSHNVGCCYRCGNVVERGGAPHQPPVVREDGASGQEGHRGGEGRARPLRAGSLLQDLPELDGERPRLVHLPAALVGPPDPRLDLRGLRPRHRLPPGSLPLRKVRQREDPPGGGRAGHLVLLRPLALLHHGLARKDPGAGLLVPHHRHGHRL